MEKAIATLQHKLGLSKSYASCTLYEDRVVLKTWHDGAWHTDNDYTNKERTIFIEDITSVVLQEPKMAFSYIYGYLQFHSKGNAEAQIDGRSDRIFKNHAIQNIIDAGGILLTNIDKEQQVATAMVIKNYIERKLAESKRHSIRQPQTSAAVQAGTQNIAESLQRLSELFSKGLLTEEEFAMAKSKIISGK